MTVDDTKTLREAVNGDRVAMGRLLMRYDLRLRRKVAGWIPRELRALLTVEDVLQDAYAEAYRHVDSFEPGGGASFYAWLVKIAERRFLNARRWLLAAKRGLRKQVKQPVGQTSSFGELLRVLSGDGSTPSRKVARRENETLMQVALAGLKDDYRDALWMRYIDGLAVRDIAKAMDRTERAVHMLCNRGLRALREQMGSASKFMTTQR